LALIGELSRDRSPGVMLSELRVLPLAVITGHDRDARLLHQRLGAILEPHGADRGRRRPHENEAGLRTGFREIGVLRETE
jgi:hypothetical protein